jgi:hypothetical protein
MGVTKWLKPSDSGSRIGDRPSVQADPTTLSGEADTARRLSEESARPLYRGRGGSMFTREA